MSDVQKTPVAILTSDWHIRSTVPASRAEVDWYAVMERRLDQLAKFQQAEGGIPIIVAGDIFDNCNPHSELVKWTVDQFRRHGWLRGNNLLCIPGNHDLYGNNYDNWNRGAYGSLCDAGAFHLEPGGWNRILAGSDVNLALWAMPWDHYDLPITNPEAIEDGTYIKIAIVHKYVYATKQTTYVGSEETDSVTSHSSWGEYFDIISIGDNHIPWKAGKFINHGSLFSLTSAQKDHEHLFGVVYSDGSLQVHKLPEEKQWKEVYVPAASGANAQALIDELDMAELDSVAFDELLDRVEGGLSENGRAVLRELRR